MKTKPMDTLWGIVNNDSGRLFSHQFFRRRLYAKDELKKAKKWGYEVHFERFKIFKV